MCGMLKFPYVFLIIQKIIIIFSDRTGESYEPETPADVRYLK